MPESTFVLKGGTVVNPDGHQRLDVRVSDGRIEELGVDLLGDRELDCRDAYVTSGLVDIHTHLREPGKEEAETIASGARAAALGGYTAVLAMPNTTPAIDSASVVNEVLALGRSAVCDVHTSAAITIGREGEQLAPMAELAELGVKWFTDDGTGVQDPDLMRRAMDYARGLDVTLAQHCEVTALAAGGCMHEGEWSARLGLAGQPHAAEVVMVGRDIELARMTGARIHFQHLSCAGSVDLVRAARAAGLPVTSEAAPHHFVLTDASCAGYDPTFKVHPPLRSEADRVAIKAGLAAGEIDAIATDHAPHSPESKELPFDQAPPGMLGLEYALALALSELELPITEVIRLLSWRPAQLVGMADHGRALVAGGPANICVIDAEQRWTIDASGGASKSRNVPYVGREVKGRVRHTMLAGQVIVGDGELERTELR